jgi:hypothetical protein
MITCAYICKPKYASINTWRSGDPLWWEFEALPTAFDRMTGGMLKRSLKVSRGLLGWVWSMWTDEGRQKTATAVKQVYNTWDGGSMFEDETL